jgi:hypothetical protein
MRAYTNAHPEETRPNILPMRDGLLESMFLQALPQQICGHTVLVTMGKDCITLESFLSREPFLSGESRAGDLTLLLLKQISAWKCGFAKPERVPFKTSSLPFVDLPLDGTQ